MWGLLLYFQACGTRDRCDRCCHASLCAMIFCNTFCDSAIRLDMYEVYTIYIGTTGIAQPKVSDCEAESLGQRCHYRFFQATYCHRQWNKWNKWNPAWNPKRREATHIHPPGGKYGPLRESSRPSGTSASVKKLATHGDAQWRHHETSLIEFDRSHTFRWKSIYKVEKPYMKQ